MTSLRMICIAALLAMGAGTLQAQQGDAAYQRARAALPGAHGAAFESVVADARARGLPIEPLVNKVLEGAAKRIPPDRIMTVVRQRADQLQRAQSLAGTSVASELVVVADALQRGVPDRTVRDLRGKAGRDEPFGLTLHTYADLVQQGVPADGALALLASWRASGARSNELRELPAAVEKLVREGASPASAAGSVAAAFRSGKGDKVEADDDKRDRDKREVEKRKDGDKREDVDKRDRGTRVPKVNKPPVKPKGSPPGRVKSKKN